MIRLLLSLSAPWWLCLWFWPVETLVIYAAVVACVVTQVRADDGARARVVR